MFRVSLADLRPRGSLRVEHEIPASDPLWASGELVLGGPARVELDLTRTAAGQILATGLLSAPLVHMCRRCLDRVDRLLQLPIDLLWAAPDALSDDPGGDAELRVLEPGANEIDLGEAIREELMLAAPRYVVCREDCRGFCPRCGTNRNEEPCECVTDEPDPRWDALRTLNRE